MISTRAITERLDTEIARLALKGALAHDAGHSEFRTPDFHNTYSNYFSDRLQNSLDAVEDFFRIPDVLSLEDILDPFRETLVRANEDWLYLSTLQTYGSDNDLYGFASTQKLTSARHFWSFVHEVGHVRYSALWDELSPGKTHAALPLVWQAEPHWADFDQVFHISSKDIQSFWAEASLRGSWTHVKAAGLKACSLLPARNRQMVDQFSLGIVQCR
jgi:hypothetical protein